MLLELINRIDVDGEWFIVQLDGKKQFFSVYSDGSNREKKKAEAMQTFNTLKENKGIAEVVLLSETIESPINNQ